MTMEELEHGYAPVSYEWAIVHSYVDTYSQFLN